MIYVTVDDGSCQVHAPYRKAWKTRMRVTPGATWQAAQQCWEITGVEISEVSQWIKEDFDPSWDYMIALQQRARELRHQANLLEAEALRAA